LTRAKASWGILETDCSRKQTKSFSHRMDVLKMIVLECNCLPVLSTCYLISGRVGQKSLTTCRKHSNACQKSERLHYSHYMSELTSPSLRRQSRVQHCPLWLHYALRASRHREERCPKASIGSKPSCPFQCHPSWRPWGSPDQPAHHNVKGDG
jgi:hypothetical protein